MKKVKIKIEGMHCASCAANVEKSIKKINGIKSVSVNGIFGKAIVESEENVTDEALKKAVIDAGYKPTQVKSS